MSARVYLCLENDCPNTPFSVTVNLCASGDLNVAHEDIDFFNPSNKITLKAAGTTPQERGSFATKILGRDPPISCLDPPESSQRSPEQHGQGEYDSSGEGVALVDTFRALHPTAKGVFSYWSMRAGNRPFNRGMRLDYCLVSRVLADKPGRGNRRELGGIHDAFVLHSDMLGYSDHCPVGVVLRL